MEFINKVKQLAENIESLKDNIKTEESTKNAFIMPMIQTLGYNVFNPLEVVPEYDADIKDKKGDKVDYAILSDKEPIMVIECKHWEENLDKHVGQLKGYFVASKSRFGILTNGIEYRFYTDLVEKNKMDQEPFLIVDLLNLKDNLINELYKFSKDTFDITKIVSSASDLKYTTAIKKFLKDELENPSEELVKLIGRVIAPDRQMTRKRIEEFTPLVKKSLNQTIKEIVNDTLQNAMTKEEPEEVKEPQVEDDGIETTEEELEGFHVVKSIARKIIDSDRIGYKDTINYFRIMVDGKVTKPICLLRFNTATNYICFFDENKEESKFKIDTIDQIYNYEEEIIQTVKRFI